MASISGASISFQLPKLSRLKIEATPGKSSDCRIYLNDAELPGVTAIEFRAAVGETSRAVIEFYVDGVDIDADSWLALQAMVLPQTKEAVAPQVDKPGEKPTAETCARCGDGIESWHATVPDREGRRIHQRCVV